MSVREIKQSISELQWSQERKKWYYALETAIASKMLF